MFFSLVILILKDEGVAASLIEKKAEDLYHIQAVI